MNGSQYAPATTNDAKAIVQDFILKHGYTKIAIWLLAKARWNKLAGQRAKRWKKNNPERNKQWCKDYRDRKKNARAK